VEYCDDEKTREIIDGIESRMKISIMNEHPRAAIAHRETPDKDKYAEFYERLLEAAIDD
jgi:hypothetical protein